MANDINITVAEHSGSTRASSGSKWEPIMGYSRAVRRGNFIAVTGSVGINADGTYSSSLADQTRRSLAIVRAAIESLGGTLTDVIRTRMYVTDVSQWEQVARVHGEPGEHGLAQLGGGRRHRSILPHPDCRGWSLAWRHDRGWSAGGAVHEGRRRGRGAGGAR